MLPGAKTSLPYFGNYKTKNECNSHILNAILSFIFYILYFLFDLLIIIIPTI
jgi:hypothetical protein